ncbi:MAG: hypothetical protein EBX30_12605 [Betaproteobacteria bacterium]|nr:hypothetical protein [Betaproteobacteria bacterium]
MQLIIATPSPFKIIHRLVDLVADGIGDDAVMTFLENQRTKGMITKCRLNRHFVSSDWLEHIRNPFHWMANTKCRFNRHFVIIPSARPALPVSR